MHHHDQEQTRETARNYIWREQQQIAGLKLVEGTTTRTAPQSRDLAWFFSALYSSAKPRSLLTQGSARPEAKLHLRMADFILFEKGRPRYWLATSETDGSVVRRSLANTYTARAKTHARQTGGARLGLFFRTSLSLDHALVNISLIQIFVARPGKTFLELMVKEQMKVGVG